MEDNLKLWKSVEKTNPKYTKKANVGGNQITSISPQYQIMNTTEQFGSYGKTWGFKQIELDYTLVPEFNLIVFKAIFFYPDGEFPTINSVKMFMDNAKTKIDDSFAKKVETDTLTKCISKLGFNADIFMGKFDDVRYVEEMKQEFAPKIELTAEQKQNETDLKNCKDIEELSAKWKSLSAYEQKRTTALTIELKNDLEK